MTEKALLRKRIKELTSSLDPDYVAESDEAIFKTLSSHPLFEKAERVFTYLSVGREPDTRQLIELCRRLGKSVALPRVGKGGMDFVLLVGGVDSLSHGPFGIPQPEPEAPALEISERDLLIVPALCYDRELYRLGHGGGYYDRFLSACPAPSIGLCRQALVLPRVPRDAFDLPVGLLITEKRAEPERSRQ